MKRVINTNHTFGLDYLPKELAESAASIFSLDEQAFSEISRNGLAALGIIYKNVGSIFGERSYGENRQDLMEICLDPWVTAESNYVPLSQNIPETRKKTGLSSSQKILLVEEHAQLINKPSLLEKIVQEKEKSVEDLNIYSYRLYNFPIGRMTRHQSEWHDISLLNSDLVVPIYKDNQNYQRILGFARTESDE